MATPSVVLGVLDLQTVEAGGVQWVTSSVTGWDDGAGSTLAAQQKPRSHGAWAGAAYNTARHIAAKGWVEAPSEDALTDALDRLKSACTLEDTVFTVVKGSASRWATVRRSDQVLTDSQALDAEWSIQVVAVDPRKFGAELTASTALPSSTAGLTLPYTLPYTIDAVTVSGQVSLTNPGNATGPVHLRIDGPVTGPVVTHVGSGLALVFASSLVLGVGDFVTVNMDGSAQAGMAPHEVLAQGQSSRNGWITSRGWSGLESGPNTWSFSAVSGSGLLTVTAVEAWE